MLRGELFSNFFEPPMIGLNESSRERVNMPEILRLRPGDLRLEFHIRRVTFPLRLTSAICNAKKHGSTSVLPSTDCKKQCLREERGCGACVTAPSLGFTFLACKCFVPPSPVSHPLSPQLQVNVELSCTQFLKRSIASCKRRSVSPPVSFLPVGYT